MSHSAVFTTTAADGVSNRVSDRHPALPIVLLLLFPFALQVPLWLLGLSTDPIWFYSSITSSAHMVPGSPFLDPNAGCTSQALGHLAAWDWLHGVIPWWNPYTGIGVPLVGELQPVKFSSCCSIYCCCSKRASSGSPDHPADHCGTCNLCSVARTGAQSACVISRWSPLCAERCDCLDARAGSRVLLVAVSSVLVMGH